MPELDYHDAHGPYIKAVVTALEAAGFAVADWFADPDDPRHGCIALAESNGRGDRHFIVWDEARGWAYGTGAQGGRIAGVGWICLDVLPEPSEVVEAVRKCMAGDYSEASLSGAAYRDWSDEDDGFEAELRAYAGGGDA